MRAFRWIAFVLVFLGCESKTIQNLGMIDAAALLRADGINVEIYLLTETGDRLIWEGGVTGTTGSGVLSETELDTKVAVWSLKSGQRHNKVYSGRLRSFHWNTPFANSYRSLLGLVPLYAIEGDEESDSIFGEMDITLVTPKQGEFSAQIYNIQIFPTGYVGETKASPQRE